MLLSPFIHAVTSRRDPLPGFPLPPLNTPAVHGGVYAPPTQLPAMQALDGVLNAGDGATVDARHASSVERMRMTPAARAANLVRIRST